MILLHCLLLSMSTLLLSSLNVRTVYSQCANQCSRNGICNIHSKCECAPGFTGFDCSKRVCPMGIAFSDFAYDTDMAHQLVECSGRGLCLSNYGTCSCAIGFVGSACERLSCPNHCSHRGRCASKKEIIENRMFKATSQVYSYSEWDSESIFGCICDFGYSGYDCSHQTCYSGDDPLTPGGEQGKYLDRVYLT
jgi:hypothetical protein